MYWNSSFADNARAHVDQIVRELLQQSGGARSTNDNKTKDGRAIVCDWYNTPVVDDQGQVIGAVSLAADITERLELDHALSQSEGMLQSIVQNAPVFVLRIDRDGAITYINRTAGNYTVQQVLGAPFHSFAREEYRQVLQDAIQRVFETGATEEYEVQDTVNNRWYQIWLAPIVEEDGIHHLVSICLDIHDRRQQRLALQQSEDRFRTLAHNVPGIVYLCANDERYTMMYLNDGVETLLGIPARDFLSDKVSFVELFHPEDASAIPSLVDAAVAQHAPYHLRYRLRHAQGHWIWMEEHGQGVYDDAGELRFLEGCLFDITEKRKAEEALLRSKKELTELVSVRTQELRTANRLLREDYQRQLTLTREIRESEEKFRNMCEDNPGPVSITRVSDGEVIYANEPLAELARLPRDELVGRSSRDFYPNPRERERLLQELNTHGQLRDREVQFRRLDGSLIWVSVSLRRTLLDGEDVVLAIYLDITERKQFNERLQSQMRMLRRMLYVHDRDRQLIAYEIHDGMVQYMTGINLFLQAAESKVTSDPAGAREDLQTSAKLLSETIEEARRLIDGLRPGVLEEQGVVPAVNYLCDQTTQLHNISTECIADVRFDRLAPAVEMAIYRIVQEGLSNVVKHSQAERASVALSQRKDQLVIKIEDRGVGFDPANIETKRYGLVGIRDRARLLGGKAKIRTGVGIGTRVRVKLPLQDVLMPQAWEQPEVDSGEDSGSDWRNDSDSHDDAGEQRA